MPENLTVKQEQFCQRYVELGIGAAAYRAAYDATGMGDDTIYVEASRLLADPKISLRVKELESLALKRHEVTVDRIVAEYSKLAFFDIRDAFDKDGNLKPLHRIDDVTASAIAGMEVEMVRVGKKMIGRLAKIKLADRKGALDSLAKYLQMFVERTELTGRDGGPIDTRSALPEWLLQRLKPKESPTGDTSRSPASSDSTPTY